jgi:hypothetical protein
MSGAEGAVAVLVFGGGVWLVRPLVAALARRVAGETARMPAAAELAARQAALVDELQHARQELADLAERMDFTERLLAKQREAERVGPPR